MKKIIMSMFTMAVASFAFAITDAEKAAFTKKVNDEFIPAIKANDALGAEKVGWQEFLASTYKNIKAESVTKPVAEWVIEAPTAAHEFIKDAGGTYAFPIVRTYLEANSLLDWQTCTVAQSAAIFDHRKQYDDAMIDKSKYSAMKSAGFVVGGIKMSNAKIQALAKKHGDIATYESMFTDEQLAQRFDEYIDIAVIAASQMNTKGAVYNLYADIEARFESKTNVSAVSKNWARFTAMLDAAAKRYERAIQFGEEQPK